MPFNNSCCKKHTLKGISGDKWVDSVKRGLSNKKGAFRRPFYTRPKGPVKQQILEIHTEHAHTCGIGAVVKEFDDRFGAAAKTDGVVTPDVGIRS